MILKHNLRGNSQPHLHHWFAHYQAHVNPDLTTRLLRKSVPVLEFIDWKVTEVREGYAASLLPLNRESTNQHGTHQAALMALAADYTGGIALASCLTGVPMAGVHPCHDDVSASLWLADMSVRFRTPSTGHLSVECQIPHEVAQKLSRRYFAGKKVFASLNVNFHSNGESVAEATMRYFAQPSIQLRPASGLEHESPIFQAKLKASARMIAGVRAQQPSHRIIRVDCPHTAAAASEHGRLLAQRLREELPQLADLVHARTQHGDEALLGVPALKQVVMVGAGLDMRPFRLNARLPDVTWFELDLPSMLKERERVVAGFPETSSAKRQPIPIDLINESLEQKLLTRSDFDRRAPTLVLYEGCSMYFDESLNRRILTDSQPLLEHPESRLWCDFVDRSVVDGRTQIDAVTRFLRGMDELGEQFIFGCQQPGEFLKSCGYRQISVRTAGEYLQASDPVYDLYRFCLAR